jgi:leucyl aminopeptidase (aminopeptidase T)
LPYHDFAPRLAQVLTEYSLPIQKGDYVAIIGSTAAEPLILELYEAVLRRGGNPVVFANLPGLGEIFHRVAADDQLDFLDPIQLVMIEN